uniref:Thioesterase domain-containing protein n=1 Tax=Ananas comosus var. bracteatus TaxID=296719 RepID=A0A6V7QL25_ANACO|nr:unnamed protein product [Ananas comosus var. bracteatus]
MTTTNSPSSKSKASSSTTAAASSPSPPTAEKGVVIGRLTVTLTCCQPFKVLNGGVSALIAESTASLGGYVASGYRRVFGVQLSTNHIKPAMLGEQVEAEATPVRVGRTIQVWEVQIRKIDPSTSSSKVLLSTSRVVLLSNMEAPKEMKEYEEKIKKYARL